MRVRLTMERIKCSIGQHHSSSSIPPANIYVQAPLFNFTRATCTATTSLSGFGMI